MANAADSNGKETKETRHALEQRWGDLDPNEIANALLRTQLGVAGDWDPPPGVEPKRPLLYLSIGIPDGRALPR